MIVGDVCLGRQPLVASDNFVMWAILPKEALVASDEVQYAYDREVQRANDGAFQTRPVSSRGGTTAANVHRGKVPKVDQSKKRVHQTKPVPSRGGTTAANVLSINVVAVWKGNAYLFTGDAHLADVTEAAQDFLHIHRMESFEYVDVPHHGSANSKVKDVDDRDLGLARIPAKHYLISHCGNHQNPSLTTVTHILKHGKCRKLHFLYPSRKVSVSCRSCQECCNIIETRNWHCECVIDLISGQV